MKKKLQDLTHSHPLNSSCTPVMCVMTAECVSAEREAQRWHKFHNSEHDCGNPMTLHQELHQALETPNSLHQELRNSSQAVQYKCIQPPVGMTYSQDF